MSRGCGGACTERSEVHGMVLAAPCAAPVRRTCLPHLPVAASAVKNFWCAVSSSYVGDGQAAKVRAVQKCQHTCSRLVR